MAAHGPAIRLCGGSFWYKISCILVNFVFSDFFGGGVKICEFLAIYQEVR